MYSYEDRIRAIESSIKLCKLNHLESPALAMQGGEPGLWDAAQRIGWPRLFVAASPSGDLSTSLRERLEPRFVQAFFAELGYQRLALAGDPLDLAALVHREIGPLVQAQLRRLNGPA